MSEPERSTPPASDHALRNRILTGWARLVTTRPILTLIFCAVLALASVAITAARLQFRSDRSELIDPSLPWQQRYSDFKARFPRWNDAVVVVDRGQSPAELEASERFITLLEERLRSDPHFRAVTAGFPVSQTPPGLILSEPPERVRAIAADLSRSTPVLATPSLDQLLGLSALGGASMNESQRADLAGLLERTARTATGEASSVLGLEQARGVQRLTSANGRLATVLVSLALPSDQPAGFAAASAEEGVNVVASGIAALRDTLAQLRRTPGLEGVQAGVTGVPVLESDETTLSMRDAALAGTLALGLITIIMLLAYRGFVVPLLAVTALLMGMAMSFAWATLSVGHLQLLSVTFASLLLGLGIDVAIHLIARLELVHPNYERLGAAIEESFRGVGPGIVTASLTVAAASAAMALTPFSGVAEMGIIAAGGIVLCTLAILSALPAMLMLLPRPERHLRTHVGGVGRPFMGRAGVAFHRRPALVIAGGVIAVAASLLLARQVSFDSDLQNLMPTTTESVRWQQRLEAEDQRGVWHAVLLAKDLDEARAVATALRALPQVADVGGAGVLIPDEARVAANTLALSRLPDPAIYGLPRTGPAGELAPSADAAAAANHEPDPRRLAALRQATSSIAAAWSSRDERLSRSAAAVAALSDPQAQRALEQYGIDRHELAQQIHALRTAAPALPDALPQALRDVMIASDGSLVLRIYLADDGSGLSVLAPQRLEPFARAVLSVAPAATGPSIQIYESTRLITGAYADAALYALAAIVFLLLIDFGFSRAGAIDTACALLPVGVGVCLMLGVMQLAGVALNFANMIVTPLIIGIGVGCGVHAVRRWRLQPSDEPFGLAGGSGRAITLTTLTTVVGFAVMMVGQHRGIWSLGFVMSVGLMGVWVATILLLPSVLALRRAGHPVTPSP